MNDTERIAHGISQAAANGREISDTTARIIAAQWHTGETSGLYAFVSTGTIMRDIWRRELCNPYRVTTSTQRDRLDWLGTYFLHHGARGPVAGWAEKTRY